MRMSEVVVSRRKRDIPESYVRYKRELGSAIGVRLAERRVQKGLSQDELRARLEMLGVYVSRSQYSCIELGETLLRASEIIALAQALDVSFEWLLQGEA
jgi:HTH-type transcriptional regulator, cell division transcriptional repressor